MSFQSVLPRRFLHRALIVVVAVLAAAAGALALGEHHLKNPLLRTLTARSGREIRIDGAFEAHLLSSHPRLIADKLFIGNPQWLPPGVTAEIGRVSIFLQWQLSLFPLRIRRLEIEGARLHLVREADGRANWHLHEEGPGNGPPLVRSLYMPDAQVELHDERRHLQFSGTVSAYDADTGAPSPALRIEGEGQLNGRKASFDISADPLAQARRDRPYHFSGRATSGTTQVTGHGFLERPFDFRAQRATFAATGPDMKDLYYLIGLNLPDTGPFHLSANLVRQNQHFEFKDLAAAFGSSALHGAFTVDSTASRTQVEGELSAERLRLADFGTRAAGRAPLEPSEPVRRLPDTPLPLNALRRTEAKVKFRAEELDLGSQTLRAVAAAVSIHHGALAVEHFSASLARGSLSGSFRLNAASAVPEGELTLSIADLQLEDLKTQEDHPSPIAGLLNGRAQLKADGRSLHELAAAANGTISAAITQGELRASLAEAASLDLTGALGALRKNHKETDIRCGVASMDVNEGTVTAHTLVLDTDDALIVGSGTVRLDSETLDLTLRGRPKHPGLALRSEVVVRGDLTHPQVHLSAGPLAAQTAAAVALGLVLTPVASVLAFVNPGLTHNADCSSLLAQARADQPEQARVPVSH